MKLATSSQMQKLDAAAIDTVGIPGIVLMENAGKGTVDALEHSFGPVQGKTVLCFIGPGNNGGDGLVIARHVMQRKGLPYLIYLIEPEKLKNDARINANICINLHIPHTVFTDNDEISQLEQQIAGLHFSHPVHSLVDSLFGTGLRRPPEGRFARIISCINSLANRKKWPVIAVDIPSGLSADTGEPLGCAVRADLSVTYGLAKPGHFLHGGATAGKVEIVDIGIPQQVIDNASLPGKLLDKTIGHKLLKRSKNSHKGSFGHLLMLAGSEGKTGAAILCAQAALRSGCGLVTMGVPSPLNPVFEISLPEAMTVPLKNSSSFLHIDDYEQIMGLLDNKNSLVLGPGLGMHPKTAELVKKLYCKATLPIVVDADALNLLAQEPDLLKAPGGIRILTPHPGEMSRLLNTDTCTVQQNRILAASWLKHDEITTGFEIITVLKGAGTVVCSSQGQWAINSSGNNAMATGGMGDVLAGLIAGLITQGYRPQDAAQLGVYLHGMAADMLLQRSACGFLANDVATNLPAAYTRLRRQINTNK